jgi:D-alanyl-D-alanine carboxypeptidase/D-alanyl-D-alanine-endopeptidase (penicillin-binding protein 4)
MLEVFNALYPLPPASVAKAVTTAYGLDRLGPGYRFRTTLVSDGTIRNGRSRRRSLDRRRRRPGARYRRARCHGPRSGRKRHPRGFGHVPDRHRCAARHRSDRSRRSCPMWATTPPISALNLNFNRVFFEWERTGEAYYRPHGREVGQPFADGDGLAHDDRAAGLPGLHVRAGPRRGTSGPWRKAHWATGAGAGFRCAVLPPTCRGGLPDARAQPAAWSCPRRWSRKAHRPGANAFSWSMSALRSQDILRGMMRWSTNLTAEVVGLTATQAGGVRPTTLGESGAEMAAWMRDRLGARQARFVDHSGLGVESRVRPNDMTRALVTAGPDGLLRGLMRDIPGARRCRETRIPDAADPRSWPRPAR